MKKQIKELLWNDFISILKDATSSYESYYSSLVSWIRKNPRYFTNEILNKSYLDILISLDPSKYIVDDPEFQLEDELNWYKYNNPRNINSLAMLIESKLWDMVSIKCLKNCPNCGYGDLRYLLLENKDQILLECGDCAWTEHVDGTKYSGGIANMLPANKWDLQRHGIKLK